MSLILFAVGSPALAQVAGSGPLLANQQPQWMETFNKIYSRQGQGAPLGSLDKEVDDAWAAALAAGPLDPSFEAVAQQAAQYFGAQGYDRKAEAILRQAISAAGQEVLGEVKAPQDQTALGTRIAALTQLAQLREQMGEPDAVEGLLREAKTLQSARPPESMASTSSSGLRFARAAGPGFASFRIGSFSEIHAGPSDLVGFYQRQGSPAKAEALLKKDLEDAKTPEESQRALQNYVHFLNSQQRWEESVAHLEN